MREHNTILIVDDEPCNIELLKMDLEGEGYTIVAAANGREGWEVLQARKDEVMVILLDRMMPEMDGMEFIAKLNADDTVKDIPVIMQSSAAQREQVVEGIRAGVYYYLTKPYDDVLMLSIVKAAISGYEEIRDLRGELLQHKNKLKIIKQCHFEIQTLEEARYLTTFLSQFYPDPGRVVLGISELLINAIEHGNLDITYDEKTMLMEEGVWRAEIDRRLQLPTNIDKRVSVKFLSLENEITLRITDEGQGFDFQRYILFDPARLTHNHGRGVAMANMMSFDGLEYLGVGNEVLCSVNR